MSLAEPPTTADSSEPVLEPILHERWVWGPLHLLLTVLLAGTFLVLDYVPLRATDLWVHVTYGEWILDHRALPETDPFLPLAEGMRVIDSAWLSQVIFAAVNRIGGLEGLAHLFALTSLASALVLARVYYLLTQRLSLTLLGLVAMAAIGWSRLLTIRPENFGMLCFAVLLWLLVSTRRTLGTPTCRPWRLWCGVPVVFALWANLHGSFPCGLLVLACLTGGQAIETLWSTRSFRALLADTAFRRLLVASELGFFACCLNPYGIDLLISTATFSANPNLRGILEWQPLVIQNIGGREFALSIVALLFVVRHSPRRITPAEVLLLLVFAGLTITGVRMMSWYAPVYVLVMAPHWSALADQFAQGRVRETSNLAAPAWWRPSWKYTLVAGLTVWVAFALSGVSRPVLGGTPRSVPQMLAATTPLGAKEHLLAHPRPGMFFAPQWWGDWLHWQGPPGMQPFVTSNIHLVPPRVWQDYLQMLNAGGDWQRLLDRYAIATVITDKAEQPRLNARLREADDWQSVYDDDQAQIFVRKK